MDARDALSHTAALRAAVRKCLMHLLKIRSWNDLAARFPPLTPDEIASYGTEEAIIPPCTAENFRVDFVHGWHSLPLNMEARRVVCIYVFDQLYGSKVAELLTYGEIAEALDTLMQWCRKRFRVQGRENV
ncbi:hypothetical protein BV20DRAFT_1057376 [Pilatotrama ljubarskyi]|nr:hypothetical protein BV20DRAFT_1057376 [Pilatotrama ljubarskyi]